MTEAREPDSYSGIEQKLVIPLRRVLLAATRPLVALLARLGVHPNLLSASQVAGGFAVLALIPAQPRLAFLLFVAIVLIDGLDGALARATGRASVFGSLVDQYCDHIREVTVVGGLAVFGALAILPAVLYGVIYVGLNLTVYLANAHGVPVPWAVKSYLIVYPALFLYLWFGVNVLTPAVMVSEALMLVVIGLGLRNLARVM
ncbi:MAG TPA: CDP-alcohol phosphatidyltransferase family protein [Dehalococcoidia bacterium]|nr:CDP-alcohol phosphatidyltransferase family protein [Dehalococcoidia bacterium]